MKTETKITSQKLFYEQQNGEFAEIDLSLPLQILFDDVISFVSQTDFE